MNYLLIGLLVVALIGAAYCAGEAEKEYDTAEKNSVETPTRVQRQFQMYDIKKSAS